MVYKTKDGHKSLIDAADELLAILIAIKQNHLPEHQVDKRTGSPNSNV